MRCIVKLRSNIEQLYQTNYFHKFHGFIYSLLKDTPFKTLHDKERYKFFCFSNLFPLYEKNGIIPEIKEGEIRSFIISSPSRILIKTMVKKLEQQNQVYIGDYSFLIEEIKTLKPKLNKNSKIVSATPIIIRIPEKNYEKYEIPKSLRMKRYVYWRPEIDFTGFVKQLEENLFKKYNEFYQKKIEEFPLFEQFEFKKPTSNYISINGEEIKLIGSIWEFSFSHLNKDQKKILEFGLDCGFGERNSYGFGFMNVAR